LHSTSAISIQAPPTHRDLPSFPTRRSSDLHKGPGPVPRGGRQESDHAGQHLEGHRGALVVVEGEVSSEAIIAGRDRHAAQVNARDRKSTRLNSSHVSISYAVFCLKKKMNDNSGDVCAAGAGTARQRPWGAAGREAQRPGPARACVFTCTSIMLALAIVAMTAGFAC